MNKRIRKKHRKIFDYYGEHLGEWPTRNYGLNILNERLCHDIKKTIDDYVRNVD